MKKTFFLFVIALMASFGVQASAATLDEALNVTGGNINFVSDGEYPWIVVTEDGRTYAQSGNAGVHSSISTLTATVTVARAATLSFDFKAWGEGTATVWDKCEFVLDGETQFTYGAYKNDWQTTSVRIEAGTHTLMWSYVKDSSLNPEGDYFAVDNVAVMTDVIIMLGDVNGDGNVTISDVTALIDYLLSGDEGNVLMINCDVNKDGKVAISDVTALIDLLLSGERNPVTCVVEGVTFTMMPVPSGSFTMGATAEQDEAYDWEKPAHQVTLTSPYYIAETEVTQALWLAVMGENPSYFTGDLQRPVERVSWNDCQTFIARLNQLTGKTFRLPTEAEWEYAARGGNKTEGYKYAGSNDIDDVAWYSGNSDNTTHPVAMKQPNELGLYDMSGNVLEWCQDWYSRFTSETQIDPVGPATGSDRVYHSGCWEYPAHGCRVSYRYYSSPTYAGSNRLGFRLAM